MNRHQVSLLAFLLWLGSACVTPAWSDESSGTPADAAIAGLEAAGGTVRPLAENVDACEVSFALSDQAITDASLKGLEHVPHVEWLYLQGTQITDEGLVRVGLLSDLTRLHVEKTQITDAGLKHLHGLHRLEYLNLYGTRVTDEGLKTLAEMPSLRRVYLWQTHVTDDGLAQLQAALPDAVVMTAAKMAPPPIEPLATGRYVRVRLVGDEQILSLAEVAIYNAADGSELHRQGQASQSSTAYEGSAERAIDGNTDAHFDSHSITHTESESYPWWQVDLGAAEAIGRIEIWNRADQTGTRLAHAVVEILDEDRQVGWQATIDEAADGSHHEFKR